MMVENKNNMSNLIDDIENSENTLIKKSKKQKTAIIVLSIILAVITGILAFLVYTNYDYLLFKVIMTQGYVYEDSLQDTIDEELEQSDSDITAYFDEIRKKIVLEYFKEKDIQCIFTSTEDIDICAKKMYVSDGEIKDEI